MLESNPLANWEIAEGLVGIKVEEESPTFGGFVLPIGERSPSFKGEIVMAHPNDNLVVGDKVKFNPFSGWYDKDFDVLWTERKQVFLTEKINLVDSK